MLRQLLTTLVVAAAPALAAAHMVYVVPSADGKGLTVVFSDTLAADPNVAIDKVAGLKLTARFEGGKESPVELVKGDHKLTADAAPGARLLYGTVNYGFSSRAEKPSLIVYHAKAVAAGVTGAGATVGDKAALEVVPVTAGGRTRFQLLAKGKPVPDAEGTVTLPDGKKEKLKTDKAGFTVPFEATGRVSAYLLHVETTAGEHEGKKYEQTRHYATVVVDVKSGAGQLPAGSSLPASGPRQRAVSPRGVRRGLRPWMLTRTRAETAR